MKALKCFMMVVLAVCLASCGGKKSSDSETSFDVTVDNTTIGGKLSQYFSLEDKTYKYEKGIIDKYYCPLNPKTTPLTFQKTEVWLSAYHGQAPFVKK